MPSHFLLNPVISCYILLYPSYKVSYTIIFKYLLYHYQDLMVITFRHVFATLGHFDYIWLLYWRKWAWTNMRWYVVVYKSFHVLIPPRANIFLVCGEPFTSPCINGPRRRLLFFFSLPSISARFKARASIASVADSFFCGLRFRVDILESEELVICEDIR